MSGGQAPSLVVLVLQILGVLGVGALLQKAFERWLNRKAMRTDEAVKLTSSAMSLLEPYREELAGVRAQLEEARAEMLELRSKVAQLERSQVEHFHLVHAHMLWDHEAVRELASRGVPVSTPPPLLSMAVRQATARDSMPDQAFLVAD